MSALGHRDAETLGILGRTYKDLARAAEDDSAALGLWVRARDIYAEAYALARVRRDDAGASLRERGQLEGMGGAREQAQRGSSTRRKGAER